MDAQHSLLSILSVLCIPLAQTLPAAEFPKNAL